MQIIKQTQFNSNLLTSWMKEDNAVHDVLINLMKKVSINMKAAREQKVYSFIYLWYVTDLLVQCQQALAVEIAQYQAILKEKAPNLLQQARVLTPLKSEQMIASPIMYQVILTLEKLDETFYLVELCKLIGYFKYQQDYFNEGKRLKGLFFKRVVKLSKQIPLNPPQVSIADYLQESIHYQNARKKRGFIVPEVLFNILQSALIPNLPQDDLEQIIKALKEKMPPPIGAAPAAKKLNLRSKRWKKKLQQKSRSATPDKATVPAPLSTPLGLVLQDRTAKQPQPHAATAKSQSKAKRKKAKAMLALGSVTAEVATQAMVVDQAQN